MRFEPKKIWTFSAIGIAMILTGANRLDDKCVAEPPAVCYPDDCALCYCLGPENTAVNAPVNPRTCNGDVVFTLAGILWSFGQDGMEYAIQTRVFGSDQVSTNRSLNNLIDAKFQNPEKKWDFGFKAGIGYNSACDGWNVSALWTNFHSSTYKHLEAEQNDNTTLLPLWSSFVFPNSGNAPILFATDIESFYKIDLNLIDIELGREYWTSKYVSLKPYVGFRYFQLDQNFEIKHKGGSFTNPGQPPVFNDIVTLENDFYGFGLKGGLNSVWNVGCGFGLYGNLAFSALYGSFDLRHQEVLREAQAPFSKSRFLETKDDFCSSRSSFDFDLGLQWSTLFCECKYGFNIALGWEQHIFFHQNQMWRINRIGATNGTFPNNTGENIYQQRRGDFTTQGLTLKALVQF